MVRGQRRSLYGCLDAQGSGCQMDGGRGLAQSLRGIDTLSAEWAGRLSTVRHGGWMLSVCRRERMELDSIREADAEMLWAFCRESAAGGTR